MLLFLSASSRGQTGFAAPNPTSGARVAGSSGLTHNFRVARDSLTAGAGQANCGA